MKFVKTKVTVQEVDRAFVELDKIMGAISDCDGSGLIVTDVDMVMEAVIENWLYLDLDDKRVQSRMKKRGYDQHHGRM